MYHCEVDDTPWTPRFASLYKGDAFPQMKPFAFKLFWTLLAWKLQAKQGRPKTLREHIGFHLHRITGSLNEFACKHTFGQE